jgi:hypothetical protein
MIAATALGDVQRFKEVKQSNTAINVIDVDMKTGTFFERITNHIEHVKDHVIQRIFPHHK